MGCRLLAVLLTGVFLFSSANNAYAQDEHLLERMYGSGVHDFYAGRFSEAHQAFTTVVDNGSRDPRVYYFRAVTLFRLGRPDEGEHDMATGAKLESMDINGVYRVGRALERVQGAERLLLEKHRLSARLATRQRRLERSRARYEAIERQDTDVLRRQVDVPLGEIDSDVPPAAESQDASDADPLAVPGEASQQPAAAADDPFGDAGDVPASDDPFGEPAAEQPAAEQPAAKTDKGVKPGVLGKVLGRALGRGLAGEKPADDAGSQPVPQSQPAADSAPDDPFGVVPEETPAPGSDEADPFGGDDEATAEDDPFA